MIIQGFQPWAGVVVGIEGVKEVLVQTLWKDSEKMPMQDAAGTLASLEQPETWMAHGLGDGRPFWHWWLGYKDGSVTVQRLTKPLSSNTAVHSQHATLNEIASTLSGIAEDLRGLTSIEQRQYVFTRSHPG